MIRVKDTYISMENIKKIEHDQTYFPEAHYIVITYFYDTDPIRIAIESFEEFEKLADMIQGIIYDEKRTNS